MTNSIDFSSSYLATSVGLKRIIIIILTFYILLFPLAQGISSFNGDGQFEFLRLTLELIKNLLLLYPFFILRKNFGLLHPLIFLPLITFLLSVVKNPISIIEPFFLNLYDSSYFIYTSNNYGLLNSYDAAYADIKMQVVFILSLVFYYLGFFKGLKWKIKTLYIYEKSKKLNVYFTLFFILTSTYLIWYLFVHQGGIESSLMEWQGGRKFKKDSLAWTLPFLEIPTYILIFWFMLKNSLIKNPLFWASFILVNLFVFFVTGSRSSFLLPFLYLAIIYVIKFKKIPWITFIVLALFAYISLGVMGSFRIGIQNEGNINWEIIKPDSFLEGIEITSELQESRKQVYSPLLLYDKVPNKVDLLYGKTYLGAIFFFIPSKIWEDKPHGGGYYNARYILEKGGDGGVPIPEESEIYWNFWWPGVIFFFFLYGQFHNWLARMLVYYRYSLIFLLIYFLTLYKLKLTAVSLISFFQIITPVLLLLIFANIIRLKKRRNT